MFPLGNDATPFLMFVNIGISKMKRINFPWHAMLMAYCTQTSPNLVLLTKSEAGDRVTNRGVIF